MMICETKGCRQAATHFEVGTGRVRCKDCAAGLGGQPISVLRPIWMRLQAWKRARRG